MSQQGLDIITKYFDGLEDQQLVQLDQLYPVYEEWNQKINVVSRKDFEQLYLHHVLHSLSLGKLFALEEGDQILDIGTGGGFPGIPLAILYPEAKFHLVDSIGKKITVVAAVVQALGLQNVTFEKERVENLKDKYDFAVTRAVAPLPKLHSWVKHRINQSAKVNKPTALLCLKGGDLKDEIASFNKHIRIYELSEFFEEAWFETKKIVHVPF